MTERPTVTIQEACAIAGVTRRTIYNWIAQNNIQYVRTPSGHVRIFRDTLQKFGNHEPQTDRDGHSLTQIEREKLP
jgi:excisionase family DNA binding protein